MRSGRVILTSGADQQVGSSGIVKSGMRPTRVVHCTSPATLSLLTQVSGRRLGSIGSGVSPATIPSPPAVAGDNLVIPASPGPCQAATCRQAMLTPPQDL